jgi:H+/Cl- antiporter ClcA
LLLTLLGVKLVMTAISLGSGLVGGIFAPAMFLGASLGSAYGKLLATVPGISSIMAAPPAYAMVGMAAVLASSAKAPLTSILLLFEITRDYRIVLPLMTAVGLSVWLVESWINQNHESLNLRQMGLDFNVEGENNDDPKIEPLLDWEKSLNSHLAEVIVNTETKLEKPGDGKILEQTLTLEKSQNH